MNTTLALFGNAYSKLEQSRCMDHQSMKQTMELVEKEITMLSLEYSITDIESILLIGIVIYTIEKEQKMMNSCKIMDISSQLNVNNFEILHYQNAIYSLREKNIIKIEKGDTTRNTVIKYNNITSLKSSIDLYNQKICLTEDFVAKLLGQ